MKKLGTYSKEVELIHNDFSSAVTEVTNRINAFASKINDINNLPNEMSQDYFNLLNKFNFQNNPDFKAHEASVNIRYKLEHIEELKKSIIDYSIAFPGYKIIYLPQILNLCQKYNLFFGSVNFFKGDIPFKNLKAIDDFSKFQQKFESLHGRISYRNDVPVTSQLYADLNHRESTYYICAPKSDFIGEGLTTIRNEIFRYDERIKFNKSYFSIKKPVKDPIVFCPVKALNPGERIQTFVVVTAWGKEASDELVVNHINN